MLDQLARACEAEKAAHTARAVWVQFAGHGRGTMRRLHEHTVTRIEWDNGAVSFGVPEGLEILTEK